MHIITHAADTAPTTTSFYTVDLLLHHLLHPYTPPIGQNNGFVAETVEKIG